VNLFIQGMRRSGTTILYDALVEDPELRCFYEPLREQDVTVGGGSGAREGDAFAETRALREEFRRDGYPGVPIEAFNWGGPRDPDLELEPDLPPHCRDFLAYLCVLAPAVAIKETRLYRKVPVLAELDPGAALIQLVRDPRAVTASIMLGRARRHLDRFPNADAFFEARTKRKLWSSRRLSERLFEGGEGGGIEDPPDFVRVLLVWKLTFEAAWREGRRLFDDRYLLVRHERLAADPAAAVGAVYRLLGRGMPRAVADWTERNVRRPEPIPFGDDPRWARAAERIGLTGALEAGGYTDLAATLTR
jgi:Sulfotransferase family